MLRLDHNRALSQIAAKTGKPVACDREARRVGQPLARPMYADYRFATIDGKAVKSMINDDEWNKEHVPADRRQARRRDHRGARPVVGRVGRPTPAIDHMHDWALGTNGKWVTMGIPSDGWYDIPKDTMFGFPVTTAGGDYKVVEGLEIDAFSRERINVTLKELQEEQEGVKHLL
jgi:malate dehydrogenase